MDAVEYKDRLFDKNCSICLDEFIVGEEILITACNHSFHVECLTRWIEKNVAKACSNITRDKEEQTYDLLHEVCPECPNCKLKLI